MRRVNAGWLLAIAALLIAGCTSFGHFTESKPLPQRIDDARILIAAYAEEIRASVSAEPPLMNKTDAQQQLDVLKRARDRVNEAEVLVRSGDPTTAEGRLKLAMTALNEVRARLAQRTAGGK